MEYFIVKSAIFSWLYTALGTVLKWIYLALSLIGVENMAVTIVVFTLIIILILTPLTIKQQKTTKLQAVMNPEIQAIQAKYKNRKDQQSQMAMQEETKAVYEKYGTSMTGGCLPMLIQLPILWALYYAIRNPEKYIPNIADEAYVIGNINLKSTPAELFHAGIIIALIIPALAGITQLISMIISNKTSQANTGNDKNSANNSMNQTMKTMTVMMPLMSLVFCYSLTASIGVYWISSAVFRTVQTLIINKHFSKVDVQELIDKNLEKQKKKREKKGIYEDQVKRAASMNTKSLSQKATMYTAAVGKKDNASNGNKGAANAPTYAPDSIAGRANMLRDRKSK